ncbi:TonB-dependent receptor plug domain-containing protein [Pseudogemmobacter sonorensis]|uniref:TonB-dependent receptor plug domain-containing protein n=1 Tax=Pseudogemmobacter sonorensis TaxID=2989681 RepID=UPI00368E9939
MKSYRTRCRSGSALSLLMTLGIAMGGAARAQTLDTEEDAQLLGTIVITASSIATTVQDAPASITVIDSTTIQETGSRDLRDVLRTIPGLNLSRTNGGESGTVSIRGLSASRTLVLVDGKRISSGGAMLRDYQGDLSMVPLDSIERIEVVRGPMSTLYGSDAMGGVINIITKKNTDYWSGSVTTDFGFAERATTGDNRKISAFVSGPVGENVSFSAWGSVSDRETPTAFTYTNDAGTVTSVPGGGGAAVKTIGGRLTWNPTDNTEWSFEASTTEEKYHEADGAHDSNLLGKDSIALMNEWQLGTGTLSSYLRFEKSSNEAWNGTTLSWRDPIEYETTTFETRYTDFTTFGAMQLEYTFGGLIAHDKLVDATNVAASPVSEVDTWALYTEGRLDVTDRLSLTGGLRLDHHDKFGEHVTPRIYANYDLGDGLMLKAGYAQAYVAPSLRSLNPDYIISSRGNGCRPYPGPCRIVGNPDLDPETSDNYEIGLNYQGDTLSWELTAFYNDVTNMIGARNTGTIDPATGFVLFQSDNIDEGKTAGIEGGLSWDVNNDLTWTNSFTYIAKSEFKYDFLETSFPMATTPEWNITSSLAWQASDKLNLSGTVTYVGKQANLVTSASVSAEAGADRAVAAGQNSKAYFLVDVAASYDLTDSTRLNVGISNLFDEQPVDEVVYREDGRLFKIGLTTKF